MVAWWSWPDDVPGMLHRDMSRACPIGIHQSGKRCAADIGYSGARELEQGRNVRHPTVDTDGLVTRGAKVGIASREGCRTWL